MDLNLKFEIYFIPTDLLHNFISVHYVTAFKGEKLQPDFSQAMSEVRLRLFIYIVLYSMLTYSTALYMQLKHHININHTFKITVHMILYEETVFIMILWRCNKSQNYYSKTYLKRYDFSGFLKVIIFWHSVMNSGNWFQRTRSATWSPHSPRVLQVFRLVVPIGVVYMFDLITGLLQAVVRLREHQIQKSLPAIGNEI